MKKFLNRLDIRIFKNKLFRKFMCNKLFWVTVGMPYVFIRTIPDWIKRDRKWCKSQKIGFWSIWRGNWKLYKDLLEDNRHHFLDDDDFKVRVLNILGDDDETNS